MNIQRTTGSQIFWCKDELTVMNPLIISAMENGQIPRWFMIIDRFKMVILDSHIK